MLVQYIGKRTDLVMALPWMAEPVPFPRKKAIQIDDGDGERLVSEFPQSFCRSQVLCKTEEEQPATIGGEDIPKIEDDAVKEPLEEDMYDSRFEVIDGRYQCPYCDKSYVANKQGDDWLVKHIAREHPDAI